MRRFALAAALASAAAPAQRLTVPAGVLVAGDVIAIGYGDRWLAGKTVEVRVDDPTVPGGRRWILRLQLDAMGNGAATFTVPAAMALRFRAGRGASERREVEAGESGGNPPR